MKKTTALLDTLFRNERFVHYKSDVVQMPLKEPLVFLQGYFTARERILSDKKLTEEGKNAARREARGPIITELEKWRDKKLASLDADLTAQRSALQPAPPKIEPRRIDQLLTRLQLFTPSEVATLFSSASDEERLVMEAASASVGRVPVKSERGIEWRPLLDAEHVREAVEARALRTNPVGVAKLQELQEIRSMTANVANTAIAEINEG